MICRAAIEDVRTAHGGRPVRYEPGSDGDRRLGSGPRSAQLLTNLLTNAIRYSPPAAAVTVAWRAEADRMILTVHNDGPPIDETVLGQILGAVQARRTAAAKASGGAGLGLYIVREIARAHGGGVGVHSEAGEGTTFSVTLPARAPR